MRGDGLAELGAVEHGEIRAFAVRGHEAGGVAEQGEPGCSVPVMFDAGPGASAKTCWRTTATTASFPVAVPENEEVVPVNVSTWVLLSGVTVGR
jgi:hypothetical protein